MRGKFSGRHERGEDELWQGDGQRVKRTLTQIHDAFCKSSMRVFAYRGAAVVVPARIIAQHLGGLNLRAPFSVHGMTKQILCKNRNGPITNP